MGVLCGAWTFVLGFTGWYKDPVMLNAFYLVVFIEIAVLIWGLRKTASEGRSYGQQVLAGSLMSLVGGAIIICSSLLFTEVAYPHYFEELRAIHAQMLRSSGKTEAYIAEQLAIIAKTQTPFISAMSGFIATVITGLISSLIIAIFYRKK